MACIKIFLGDCTASSAASFLLSLLPSYSPWKLVTDASSTTRIREEEEEEEEGPPSKRALPQWHRATRPHARARGRRNEGRGGPPPPSPQGQFSLDFQRRKRKRRRGGGGGIVAAAEAFHAKWEIGGRGALREKEGQEREQVASLHSKTSLAPITSVPLC